ncbi:MAG: ATP-dependent helicase [archaeon]|nr:ATP-dependent helicase [archaeon]
MNLNAKQNRAVFKLTGNTLISASPGSGKTRTLVARAVHKLDILPKYKTIALITYTNAAADEIASRLVAEKNVFIGTIHSFCLKYILRPFSWIYNWNRPYVISYEQQKEFFEANADINLEETFGQNKFDELGKIRKKLDGTLDFDVEWNHTINLKIVASMYYDYQKTLKVIDFNKILYRSYKIVSQNEFVAKSLASKFYEILVDEFQDTNLYQYEILKTINQHGDCSFFMVGDEKQKIFSFAGAIEDSFEKAKNDFAAKHAELTETYRSTNSIVRAYSSIFENHPIIDNKSDYRYLNIKVSVIKTKKDNHQAYLEDVVNQLLGKCDIELSEIAILSTSWFTAFPASKALRQKYSIVGLGALPHKRISNSTVFLLRALSRHYVSSSIKTLRSIKRNIDMHLLENGLQFSEKKLNKKTNNLISHFLLIQANENIEKGIANFKSLFDEIFKLSHSTFDEIINLISDDEKHTWDIGQYIRTLAGVDGITCNTIHKIKGLEFDAVILNEMNENKIPYQKCISSNPWTYEDLSEEDIKNGRNLFYVAVSRARKHLIVLHNWKPSMFVDMIKN